MNDEFVSEWIVEANDHDQEARYYDLPDEVSPARGLLLIHGSPDMLSRTNKDPEHLVKTLIDQLGRLVPQDLSQSTRLIFGHGFREAFDFEEAGQGFFVTPYSSSEAGSASEALLNKLRGLHQRKATRLSQEQAGQISNAVESNCLRPLRFQISKLIGVRHLFAAMWFNAEVIARGTNAELCADARKGFIENFHELRRQIRHPLIIKARPTEGATDAMRLYVVAGERPVYGSFNDAKFNCIAFWQALHGADEDYAAFERCQFDCAELSKDIFYLSLGTEDLINSLLEGGESST